MLSPNAIVSVNNAQTAKKTGTNRFFGLSAETRREIYTVVFKPSGKAVNVNGDQDRRLVNLSGFDLHAQILRVDKLFHKEASRVFWDSLILIVTYCRHGNCLNDADNLCCAWKHPFIKTGTQWRLKFEPTLFTAIKIYSHTSTKILDPHEETSRTLVKSLIKQLVASGFTNLRYIEFNLTHKQEPYDKTKISKYTVSRVKKFGQILMALMARHFGFSTLVNHGSSRPFASSQFMESSFTAATGHVELQKHVSLTLKTDETVLVIERSKGRLTAIDKTAIDDESIGGEDKEEWAEEDNGNVETPVEVGNYEGDETDGENNRDVKESIERDDEDREETKKGSEDVDKEEWKEGDDWEL